MEAGTSHDAHGAASLASTVVRTPCLKQGGKERADLLSSICMFVPALTKTGIHTYLYTGKRDRDRGKNCFWDNLAANMAW